MSLPAAPRRLLRAWLPLAFVLHLTGPAPAEGAADLPPVLGTTQLYASERLSGLALNGFDPVSYLLDGAPRPGRAEHEFIWRGLAWRFANAANRAAFVADPERFAPRIGGYDAERAAAEIVVPGNPELFVVRGGALYLFRSEEHRRRFLADEMLLRRAEARWRQLRESLVQG